VRTRNPKRVDLDGDLVDLVETSAVRSDGTVQVKLISPGWGTKGYYSSELLESDGPSAFPAGTQMFFDHPDDIESRIRPERSLRDLAGALATPARFDPSGPTGAGLYAEAKVFSHYQPLLEEMAPHIGVSIRALGTGQPGEAEGRRGLIVESIDEAVSVDYVTKAGRGGQVLPLLESARRHRLEEVGEAGGLSVRETENALRAELSTSYEPDGVWLWVKDLGDDWVVWEIDGGDGPLEAGCYQASYTIDGDAVVAIGTPQKVQPHTTYEPITESTPPAGFNTSEEELEMDEAAVIKMIDDKLAPIADAVGKLSSPEPETATVTESERKALEKLLYVSAYGAAAELFAEGGDLADRRLPQVTVTRLVEEAARTAPHDDDLTLDRDSLVARLTESADQAVVELAEATGRGKVRGMGSPDPTVDPSADTFDRAAAFVSLGLSEAGAKTAAAIR